MYINKKNEEQTVHLNYFFQIVSKICCKTKYAPIRPLKFRKKKLSSQIHIQFNESMLYERELTAEGLMPV